MRKHYDFSKDRRLHPDYLGATQAHVNPAPLSRAQIRELRRRAAAFDDPTRYLIVSGFGRRFQLYYNVEDNGHILNEPKCGTLFKDRSVALAVARALGPHVKTVKCMTRLHRGKHVLVLKSVPKLARWPAA